MGTLLDIHAVTAFRGSTKVFDRLSLQIDEECSTAVRGPNGAGKSTLLKLVSGELHPVFFPGSHIRVFGRDRWNVRELRSRLGIVSHDLQHDYLSSARGLNVVLSGFYSSIDTWRNQSFNDTEYGKAAAVMERLGILGLKDREFGSLSAGEQRRLLLARALVSDPDTLLFDEPTTGARSQGLVFLPRPDQRSHAAGQDRSARHAPCARNTSGNPESGDAPPGPGVFRKHTRRDSHLPAALRPV